jgi:uncharacterized membrane protein
VSAAALGLGVISGLRSTSGPAFLSRAAARGDVSLEGTPFSFLGSPRVSGALLVAMAGEMVVDKLPIAPSRTVPPSLLGRAASGALAGAALFAAGERRIPAGGLLGAASAVAAAFAGEWLRAGVAQKTGAPDPLVALLEDGVVLLVGHRALRRG